MNTTVVVGNIVDGLFARNVSILANSSQQVSFFLCVCMWGANVRVVYVSTGLTFAHSSRDFIRRVKYWQWRWLKNLKITFSIYRRQILVK